jgi:hypothetical protein
LYRDGLAGSQEACEHEENVKRDFHTVLLTI